MASSIHPNPVSLQPTMQDMESAFQQFIRNFDNKSSDRPAMNSRPDVMRRFSPPTASSIPQDSVSVNPINQDMAASQSFVKELEDVSSDHHVGTNRPWIRDEPMPHTADLLEHEILAMAFTKLMAMDDPFDTFPRPFILPLDTWVPTEPCYLFSIPRELRDMITDIAISSGDIGILQTSKQWHDEGIGFLYKRRICHVNINITKHVPRFNLPKPVAALIQNVTVKIVLEGLRYLRRWGRDLEPIRKFSSLTVPRQTCRVVVLFSDSFDGLSYLTGMDVPHQVMEALRTLIGFSRVTLEFHDRAQPSARHSGKFLFRRMVQVKNAREQWSCGLGPSVWHSAVGSDDGYLEFNPREHWEANPGALSPTVQRLIDRWATNE